MAKHIKGSKRLPTLTVARDFGRKVAALRVRLESIVSEHDVKNLPGYPLFACFAREWYAEIFRVSALGMTGCTLRLNYPNPTVKPISEIKPKIEREVRSFFKRSGFTVSQLGDWKMVYEFKSESREGTQPETTASILVLIMVGWHAPRTKG